VPQRSDRRLYTFDFDDYRVINHQVETIFPDRLSLINDRKYWLPDMIQVGIVQLNAKRCFVSSFQKSRSKLAMDFNSASDYSLGQLFKRSALFVRRHVRDFFWS